MKLYHCKGSRSTRVLWLFEELGLDYELEVLPFDPKALRSADYLQVSPFGKVPVLVDDTLTMFESVAIIQYVLEHYGAGRLRPHHESPHYGYFLQWLHFGESTLMVPVAQIAAHTMLLPETERSKERLEEAKRVFHHYAEILDRELQGHEYLVADEFSAADIVVGYTLYAADQCGALPDDLPALRAYYDRLAARPAFKKATA
ncbi:MAG TPA: glutathione S-transferase family protein [Gammaproteobacteria bacterium]